MQDPEIHTPAHKCVLGCAQSGLSTFYKRPGRHYHCHPRYYDIGQMLSFALSSVLAASSRMITGTEVGGTTPTSVTTIVIYFIGVTSYTKLSNLSLGISRQSATCVVRDIVPVRILPMWGSLASRELHSVWISCQSAIQWVGISAKSYYACAAT